MSASDDHRVLTDWWTLFALARCYPTRPADGRFEAVCPQPRCTASVVVHANGSGPTIECAAGCDRWEEAPSVLVRQEAQRALDRLTATFTTTDAHARPELRLVDMAEAMRLASQPIDYLCRPLAARGFLTVLAGRPGEAKSWLMLAVANAVQTGAEAVGGLLDGGLRCRRGGALYVDAENGRVLLARRFTLMGMPADGVRVADAIGLRLPDDVEQLEALIELAAPDLVVLDSLRRLAPGAKENDSDAMAPLLGELARVARERNVALVLIHHRSTKAHAADVRGSSAIEDQTDLAFVLERLRGDPDRHRRRLRCVKDRIDPEPAPIWLRLTKTAGFVGVEGAEPWERADGAGAVEEELAPEALADRIRALAAQVASEGDGGWPPWRVAAAVDSDQGNGTFKRAMNVLLTSGEWEATGSTKARPYRPLDADSDQPSARALGGQLGLNGDLNGDVEEGES